MRKTLTRFRAAIVGTLEALQALVTDANAPYALRTSSGGFPRTATPTHMVGKIGFLTRDQAVVTAGVKLNSGQGRSELRGSSAGDTAIQSGDVKRANVCGAQRVKRLAGEGKSAGANLPTEHS